MFVPCRITGVGRPVFHLPPRYDLGIPGRKTDLRGAAEPKTIRILLVEDNAGDVYLLEKTLKHRQLSYELIRYADGEQAILGLRKDDCRIPDLIILDLNLPRRGGFEVLQTIRFFRRAERPTPHRGNGRR
ncbi:MAG: hypothetical protein C5B51_15115 [Terriglobia bacterium]|nr:MAG: hypothetical protein C5B51_15115 [Terriglobia bacterium]